MNLIAVYICCCGVFFAKASAESNTENDWFRFASYYQDNMVLQRSPHRAVIWGYGIVGANVTVVLNNTKYTTNVTRGPINYGVWKVKLDAQKAGGPFLVMAYHDIFGFTSKIKLKNVLFGDVWVCSGQSNMQLTLSMAFNMSDELRIASSYNQVRLFTVGDLEFKLPLYDLMSIVQPWSIPSAETLAGPPWTYFSAVCWMYGRRLHDVLGVPVGLISSAFAGSTIEAWISSDALQKCCPNIPNWLQAQKNKDITLNSVLWNAMIHPLLNMTIKGVVWYQGESNAMFNPSDYSSLFPAMIRDWRNKWFEGTEGSTNKEFPFGFVQLSAVSAIAMPNNGNYPMLRWHQTADYGYVPNKLMPNTFMAVTMDLADPYSPYGSIHPRDKQDVAVRLLVGSLNIAYGYHVNPNGPFPILAKRTKGYVVLVYSMDQQLLVKERGNFEVCCKPNTCGIHESNWSSDWKWSPISSYTNHTITLDVQKCVNLGLEAHAIRYAWALSPCKFKQCSVYNDKHFPAPPFYMPLT